MAAKVYAVRADGLREAIDHLREYEPAVRRRFTTALRQAGAITLARARAEAPYRSGRLAGDLKLRTAASKRRVGVWIGGVNPYIGVILFGKQASHGGHGHSSPHIRTLTPNPFLPRAVEATSGALRARVIAEIAAATNETFGT